MHPERTKAKILAATDQLFGELGFDATSTRDIAARSGVNKALIHYHYRTKDELLSVLLDGYYDRLTTKLVKALGLRTRPREQLEDVLDAYADFLAANRTFCTIVQREVGSGRHMEKIVQRTLPLFQLGTTWLQRLSPRALAAPEFVHLLTSVYGMVVTYFTYGQVLHALTGADPFSAEALLARKRHVRRVVALLFAELERLATRIPGGRHGTAPPEERPAKGKALERRPLALHGARKVLHRGASGD